MTGNESGDFEPHSSDFFLRQSFTHTATSTKYITPDKCLLSNVYLASKPLQHIQKGTVISAVSKAVIFWLITPRFLVGSRWL